MGVIEDLAAKVDGLKCELDLMRDEMTCRFSQASADLGETNQRVDRLAAKYRFLSVDTSETDKDIGATNDRINRLNEKVCDMRHVLDRIERMLPLPCAKATVTDSEKTQSSTVPGTWAWACEQMLAGKTVRRPGYLQHEIANGTLKYRADDDDDWGEAFLIRADLTATDWQVVE